MERDAEVSKCVNYQAEQTSGVRRKPSKEGSSREKRRLKYAQIVSHRLAWIKPAEAADIQGRDYRHNIFRLIDYWRVYRDEYISWHQHLGLAF